MNELDKTSLVFEEERDRLLDIDGLDDKVEEPETTVELVEGAVEKLEEEPLKDSEVVTDVDSVKIDKTKLEEELENELLHDEDEMTSDGIDDDVLDDMGLERLANVELVTISNGDEELDMVELSPLLLEASVEEEMELLRNTDDEELPLLVRTNEDEETELLLSTDEDMLDDMVLSTLLEDNVEELLKLRDAELLVITVLDEVMLSRLLLVDTEDDKLDDGVLDRLLLVKKDEDELESPVLETLLLKDDRVLLTDDEKLGETELEMLDAKELDLLDETLEERTLLVIDEDKLEEKELDLLDEILEDEELRVTEDDMLEEMSEVLELDDTDLNAQGALLVQVPVGMHEPEIGVEV